MATGQCYWPNQGDSQRAVIDCLEPNASWSLYPFTTIKYETDDYPKAAAKLKLLLQGFSDIGSSTSDGGHQGNRRKRLTQKKRWMSSSDSDEDRTFSAKPSNKSCVDENEPPLTMRLPTRQFTPHPSAIAPRAASRLRPEVQPFGMLPHPRPEAQPFSMLPHPRPEVPTFWHAAAATYTSTAKCTVTAWKASTEHVPTTCNIISKHV
ncbi:hypothetical protein C0Q70_02509 [Pomacea canaliculata]|uniref:Uncharacterized protein n=1 Tax=Pomacea canaliculata TaxID=400727 RepID=A0A2T7PQ43_POMCA|nr:hypothetical protein C0Q70_02509 [Pomacea canaliculata]